MAEVTQQQISQLKQRAESKKMELVRAKTQLESAEENEKSALEKLTALGVTEHTAEETLDNLKNSLSETFQSLQDILDEVDRRQASVKGKI